MPNFNFCAMMGHLTADPELKQLQSGTVVCDFTIAVHRYMKQDEEDVVFMPVTAWGKMGESCKKYLRKGSCAHVNGHLKQDNWQTQDGSKRSAIKLVAEAVQFISRPNDNGSKHGQQGQQQNENTIQPRNIDPKYGPGPVGDVEDDIPF